jgi:hypothetical protein
MDDKLAREDAILAAITRVWDDPKTRLVECTRFATSRRFVTAPGTVYPMILASVLASLGWTDTTFLRAIS